MITDAELSLLRTQALFNATSDGRSVWEKLADALKELQERREKDKQETST